VRQPRARVGPCPPHEAVQAGDVSELRVTAEIRPAHLSNYSTGRRNTAVDLVVLHTAESERTPALIAKGSIPSAVHWFSDARAKASAHYVVGREGKLWQCVAEGDAAWHAGNAAYNLRSIGIEVEGFAAHRDTWTPEVLAALTTLCADIAERHGLPPDRRHFIGHREVPDGHGGWGGAGHHEDPGPWLPWDDLLESIYLELAAGPLPPAPVPPATLIPPAAR
jgi:N-acetyl-anhydromuramyl-L-alanine amidase AmpD